MARKTVPQLVRAEAEKWRDALFSGRGRGRTSLEREIHEYLKHTFHGSLDVFLGVRRRSFDEVELVEHDKGNPTLIQQLLLEAKKPLVARLKKLLDAEIVLTPREQASLQKRFRESLLGHIAAQIEGLAEERATIIAQNELDRLMSDDEWVSLLEGRLEQAKDK